MVQYKQYEVMLVSFKEIIEFLKKPTVLIGLGILILLLFVILFYRAFRKKNLAKRVEEYEILYNTCISVPISFKLNKATNIAKLNPSIDQELQKVKNEYLDLEKRHEEIAVVLEDFEDAISFGKLKLASSLVYDLEMLVMDTEKITLSLDGKLDKMLEDEMTQREEITDLKDVFRTDKTRLMNNMNLYGQSYTQLESISKSIEDKFSEFEEWMFANDYEKAKALSEVISLDLKDFSTKLDSVPELYALAKGEIPELLDQISASYQEARNQSVYLAHMDVPKSIIFVSDKVKENLKNISHLELEIARENLEHSKEALLAMQEAIDKEVSTHQEMQAKMQTSFNVLDEFTEDVEMAHINKSKVAKRFNFDNYETEIDTYTEIARDLLEKKDAIQKLYEENMTPSTKQILILDELVDALEENTKTFYDLSEKVRQANADEIRAQEQLRKLYLIINDVEVRIKKRSLPSISKKYTHDLERSRAYVHQINNLLKEDVLDVSTLNGTVSEAIDYIYQLHNNVNNLVGVVDMCENSIVYANKYRAYVPDIESELTKAELAFNNGEYTQSLTMIIEAIERFKPNTSYEEMIKNNAKSAR